MQQTRAHMLDGSHCIQNDANQSLVAGPRVLARDVGKVSTIR